MTADRHFDIPLAAVAEAAQCAPTDGPVANAHH